MKFRFAAIVIIFVASCAVAAKAPSGQVIDSGSFGVYLNGSRVATETFKIEQRPDGSTAKSELRVQDGATQRSEMELTPQGNIIHYGWEQLQPTKEQVTVVPKDEFLSETINAGPNQKIFNVPHLMPHSTPILEDNFFLHREILMWRYLAAGCTSKPEGLQCSAAPQQFGVLVPAQHLAEKVTIDFKDREKISVKGKQVECSAFHLHTEESDWVVFLDDQEKMVRLVASAAGLEVVRD
ncbi:MAG TPA: hypothetical protein VJT08_11460 [Terriglobales bacterium]|jgi:hypothetical protein|nr:hypothetical protein [Terriglobales bacterium]